MPETNIIMLFTVIEKTNTQKDKSQTMEKIDQVNSNQKKACQENSGTNHYRNKEICCIMINDSIHWEDISILNLCVSTEFAYSLI